MRKIHNIAQLFFQKKQLKETFWAYLAKGIFLFSGLFFLYIIPKQLGVDHFGKFTLLQSYISLLQLFFGTVLFSGIKKELIEYKFNQKSLLYFSQLIRLCFILFIAASLIFLIITSFVNIPVLSDYRFYFLGLMLVTILCDLLMLLFLNTHRIFFITIMYFFKYGVKVILIVLLILTQRFTFSSLIIIFIIGYMFSALVGIFLATTQFENWSIAHILKGDKKVINKILYRTKFLGLSSISSLLSGRSDAIILSFLVPLDILGYYSIAAEITRKAIMITQPMVMGVIPLIAHTKNKIFLLKKSIKQLMSINLLLMIGFLAFGKILIILLYGTDYQLSVNLLYILSATPLIIIMEGFFSNLQVLNDDNKAILIITISRLILNPIISVLLIIVFGVYGAAIAYLLIGLLGLLASWLRVKKIYFNDTAR